MVQVGVSVFTVHIVSAGARVVLDPDTIVLDAIIVLLGYFIDIEDLTGGLLHLSHLVHEIPEARPGDDSVGSEELHSVCLGVSVSLGGSLAANNLV